MLQFRRQNLNKLNQFYNNFLHLETQDFFSFTMNVFNFLFSFSWVSFNVFLRDISSFLYYFHCNLVKLNYV